MNYGAGWMSWSKDDRDHGLTWVRVLLGDEPIERIDLPVGSTDEYCLRVKAMFPEADLYIMHKLEPPYTMQRSEPHSEGVELYVGWPFAPQ
jgi:hypothetical protein